MASAVWSGIGITRVTLLGWHLFDSTRSAGQLAGIALMLVGGVVVAVVARGSA